MESKVNGETEDPLSLADEIPERVRGYPGKNLTPCKLLKKSIPALFQARRKKVPINEIPLDLE